MNFDDILNTNKIDKFISSNRYDPDLVSSLIQFINTKEIRDFCLYKSILNSITDNKLYTDLALVWNLLILSINDKDYSSFVNICDKLSVSLIQKCKGSLYSKCIIKNMVDISIKLYDKQWEYESTVVIYTTSLFITSNSNKINDEVISKYYELVSCILLKGNYFYSYIHAISKLNYKKKVNKKIFEYIKYKNEGNKFMQILLKMDMSDDVIKKYFSDCDNTDILEVDYEKWDFYIKNIGNKISYKDNIIFLSFMIKNNLLYKKEGDFIEILNYKYQSVDNKVHDIIDIYREKKEIKQKKVEENKKVVQKKIEKKKEIKHLDNFSVRKAKYNIYCDILKKREIDQSRELFYKERNQEREKQHNLYNKILEDKKIFFIEIKDDLEDMYKELVSRKKDNISEYVKPVIKSVSRSWRDDDIDDKVVGPVFVKKQEIISDRLIYTYGGNNTDSYIPPKNNIDKPYTPTLTKPYTPFNNSSLEKPYTPTLTKPYTSSNISSTDKPYTPTLNKSYTPSNISSTDKPYTPTLEKPYTPTLEKPYTPTLTKPYTPPSRNNTQQGNVNKKDKWYDDN